MFLIPRPSDIRFTAACNSASPLLSTTWPCSLLQWMIKCFPKKCIHHYCSFVKLDHLPELNLTVRWYLQGPLANTFDWYIENEVCEYRIARLIRVSHPTLGECIHWNNFRLVTLKSGLSCTMKWMRAATAWNRIASVGTMSSSLILIYPSSLSNGVAWLW